MKIFTNKSITKKIFILIIAIILFNAFAPMHYVLGDADSDSGGKLFKPIFKFLSNVVDLVIRGLQYLFLGDGNIEIENPRKASW